MDLFVHFSQPPFFTGCYDGNVYCLHLKTGRIIWKYQTGDVVKCSAISCKEREKIFVGSYDGYIYCLSAKVHESICYKLYFISVIGKNLNVGWS